MEVLVEEVDGVRVGERAEALHVGVSQHRLHLGDVELMDFCLKLQRVNLPICFPELVFQQFELDVLLTYLLLQLLHVRLQLLWRDHDASS